MKIKFFLLLFFLFTYQAHAQTIGKIQETVNANYADLVKILPPTEQDSRSAWMLNYPEDFDQYDMCDGILYIAMPNKNVKFTLIVVPNDTTKPIRTKPYKIQLGTPGPNPPGPNPPDPNPPGPNPDWESKVEEDRFNNLGRRVDTLAHEKNLGNRERVARVFLTVASGMTKQDGKELRIKSVEQALEELKRNLKEFEQEWNPVLHFLGQEAKGQEYSFGDARDWYLAAGTGILGAD